MWRTASPDHTSPAGTLHHINNRCTKFCQTHVRCAVSSTTQVSAPRKHETDEENKETTSNVPFTAEDEGERVRRVTEGINEWKLRMLIQRCGPQGNKRRWERRKQAEEIMLPFHTHTWPPNLTPPHSHLCTTSCPVSHNDFAVMSQGKPGRDFPSYRFSMN